MAWSHRTPLIRSKENMAILRDANWQGSAEVIAMLQHTHDMGASGLWLYKQLALRVAESLESVLLNGGADREQKPLGQGKRKRQRCASGGNTHSNVPGSSVRPDTHPTTTPQESIMNVPAWRWRRAMAKRFRLAVKRINVEDGCALHARCNRVAPRRSEVDTCA
eukprot:3202519-Amphidinium_carterae.4